MLLVLAIQVRSGVHLEDGGIALEVSNAIGDPTVSGNPTFESTIYNVGEQAKAGSAISCEILFCGTVAAHDDVVT